MTEANIALSTDELVELDDFLLSEGEERLTIDEAHGYITALIISNVELDEAAMLTSILGEDEQQENIVQLLQRMYQEISVELASGKPFEPMVIEEEENGEIFEVYEGWCYGFMLAVSDHETAWAQLSKDGRSLLEPIATLALLREEELDIDDEEYSGWVGLLAGSVSGLYSHWHC